MRSPEFEPVGASDILRGGGEMGALMRSIDWSRTGVGPVERWPQSLRTALSILLETGFPMYIAWGPDFTQFYNDGYRPILGSTKHPAAMGAGTRETFAEIWDIIGPMFTGVMSGTATTVVDFMLPLDRHGFPEECYFIFSYSPIRQEDGSVGGVLVTVTETTPRVLGERRLRTTQALAARTRDAASVAAVCAIGADVLRENRSDIPFALLYLVASDRQTARLEQACWMAEDHQLAPVEVSIHADEPWPLGAVLASGEAQLLELSGRAIDADGQVVTRALALPIVRHGESAPMGLLVAGLSPHLMADQAYRDFLTMVASQMGTAIASARAFEEARMRAAALAELDRAKTAFFSNVSHEFRTPLTLLLGPAEEAVASGGALRGDDLMTVYRNAQRLLKLVNTLLDFSRIEAGRVEALFEPTDLSALTADLASAFRSATERAGLSLVVDCPPLPEPVYVDRSMWEKVVLNLISNAFKFTFDGTITVSLAWRGTHVELTVADTGTGIPAEDLPKIFDRFYRVERSRGRTFEGSGIGLALVRELIAMHAGTIDADSEPGRGTTFTITVPSGTAHLPPERIGAGATASAADAATPYVQEALRWLPVRRTGGDGAERIQPGEVAGRVLVADDNADMRDYIARILGERWVVETVADGVQALARAQAEAPDVILSDVMMPGLDGFGLLSALRSDERTRSIPVILLSARAGEEARVEGLQAGADDYLGKPFAARELAARVHAQILKSQIRRVEEEHTRRLTTIFENAPVGLVLLSGPSHVFEFANRAYLEMVGMRPLIGKPIRIALPELAGQGIYELLDGVYASGTPYAGRSLRIMIDRGDGEPVETFYDFVYQPLREGSATTGIAVVCFDVTDLARARRDAEAANRAKDEFLAMLGHELRNPLAPILTALQLMQLRGVSGAERERLIIERQVKHVVGLVDDLLDVSRIARGKVHLRMTALDLAAVVAKAIEMTGPAIDERRHTLTVDVAPGLSVDGDPGRLAQVVANLLTNAAKYTEPHGTIRVSAAREGAEVVLRVSDNGRGIPPDLLPRIFDLFVQERQDPERSQGGLGIGLAIVRSLVQAHGGVVHAESRGVGLGSTFTVALPARLAPGPDPAPEPVAARRRSGTGWRILVVDDNRDAASLLAESLSALGHTVEMAHDGPSALAAAALLQPHVALLDLGLPVMDGVELGERLRAEPGLDGILLIALTGYAQEVDRNRTSQAGFDGHLVKPVDVLEVDRLVRSSLGAASASETR